MLILGGEGVVADLKLESFQQMERLTFANQGLDEFAAERRPFPCGIISSNSAIAGRLRSSHSLDWLSKKPVRDPQ